jgi:Protein of unknown function (DUF1761)
MSAPLSVAIAAVAMFAISLVYYPALTPVEVRVLGPAALDRGGRPSDAQVLLELSRRILLGAVIAGVAHAGDLHGVGSTVLLGLVLWLGFPFVLLTGSMMWEKVPAVTPMLHAGDWLLKLVVISAIVGL